MERNSESQSFKGYGVSRRIFLRWTKRIGFGAVVWVSRKRYYSCFREGFGEIRLMCVLNENGSVGISSYLLHTEKRESVGQPMFHLDICYASLVLACAMRSKREGQKAFLSYASVNRHIAELIADRLILFVDRQNTAYQAFALMEEFQLQIHNGDFPVHEWPETFHKGFNGFRKLMPEIMMANTYFKIKQHE